MHNKTPLDFEMCRYCGGRVESAVDRWGKPRPDGWYCSPVCARSVHGFDNRIAKERGHTSVSFDPRRHDAMCPNTREPWEYIDGDTDDDNTRACDALEAMRNAARVDPRLPGILSMLADGMTQAYVARRFGVSQQRIAKLLSVLRASISAA